MTRRRPGLGTSETYNFKGSPDGVGESALSTWELIKTDASGYRVTNAPRLAVSVLTLSPFWLVVLYRVAHGLRGRGVRLFPGVLRAVGLWLWGADIWPDAAIGPRFRVAHATGIVIGDGVRAGSDLMLFAGVVLGGSAKARTEWGTNQPRLGDGVTIGSHAVIAGAVQVGDRALIGANAVVLEDVPPEHTVRSPESVVSPRSVR